MPMMMPFTHGARLFGAVLAALVWVMSPGCGGGPDKGPGATLDAYGRALQRRDYDAAYDMMSSRFRETHSREEFIRMVKESSEEARATAEQLRARPDKVVITAELEYHGTRDRLSLVNEKGAWRLTASPVLFYSQATPRDALRSFVRAYRLKRWDVMLRFVPSLYRERMDADKLRAQFEGEGREDIDVMLKLLEANLDAPIKESGDEALMLYGDRYEVKFLREDGQWKIVDID